MSPNRRERDYARRRYLKWQSKQSARLARRRKVRRNGLAVLAAVAVLAVAVVTILFTTGGGSSSAAPPTTPSAAASSSVSASSAANNPCPKPTVTPPAHPKSWSKPPADTLAANKSWQLTLTTSCGALLIELDGKAAPKAVSSTIFLTQQGFYNSTPCHRLTTAGIYVLQCGDPTATSSGGPGYSYGPVENAPKDNVYPAGTVAMARGQDNGSSMGSQFFLVYKDSTIPSDSAGGYTVVGKITGGLAVLEKVAAGGVSDGGSDGAPSRAISIVTATAAAG